MLGHIASESLHGAFCLPLLQQREGRVHHDHHDDGPTEGRDAGHEGEGCGGPEQEGERVRQLLNQFPA
ncbi:hypothetical protein AMK26_20100 [Streptomyces sp. CB03234]|nr:hypothetical protein AMK26_20100 [Streptomyces sp. CB03234]